MIAKSVPLLLQYHEQLFQLYKDLCVVMNMEKSDFEPSSMAQYLRLLIDFGIWRTSFLLLAPPTKMWQ